MICGHCHVDFHPDWQRTTIHKVRAPRMLDNAGKLVGIDAFIVSTTCSKCNFPTFKFEVEPTDSSVKIFESQFYPRGGKFPSAPSSVPNEIATDYAEANEVLTISPKASAALSRRCLQAILSAHGYSAKNLVQQVEEVINETDASKALPSAVRENIDAIRNFGNFSAHPITDKTTLQIVGVEEGEAEWCLELLTDLFDHYYVAPAKAAKRRADLASKLSNSGKPPMK